MKLDGITCLDLSLFLPGPTVTQMMADHGVTRTVRRLVEDDAGREHLGTPLKFTAEPAELNLRAPAHGEHTDGILVELGYDAARISHLKQSGVV